jgi:hypothetical protein
MYNTLTKKEKEATVAKKYPGEDNICVLFYFYFLKI